MKKTLPGGGKKTRRVKVKEEDFSNVKPEEVVLSFGMHSGKVLKDVPYEYLCWLVQNVANRPGLVEVVKRYLNVSSRAARVPRGVRISSITGLKNIAGLRGTSPPSPAPVRNAGDDIIDECSRWIESFYQKAAGINPLNLKDPSQYRVWMDTCRKMQCIIDKDEGDHSQEAQVALRALRALLVVPSS
jgi:uncharacterized protein (DUF3820 family)